jgi:hypothetical protein
MAVTPDVKSDAEHMALLDRLIAERGIDRYGLYLLTSENLFTPDGYEEMSGYVVSSDGGVYFFWTSWHNVDQRVVFETWQAAELQSDSQDSEEYQAARKAAGLA